MNIEQAVAMNKFQKQHNVASLSGRDTKTATQIAEIVFDLSAAAGEPYQDAVPEAWAKRWLASKNFVLVELDPRQVAVPYVNKISRTKVLATMQAAADSIPPIIVDFNLQGIGKTGTGYIPSLIVVDGKHRHRAQVLAGRDRISAWVGERALEALRSRAAAKKNFVVEASAANVTPRFMSKIDIAAALMGPGGGSPLSPARQDTGDGGSRPVGSPHSAVGMKGNGAGSAGAGTGGASAGGGPGGGVSGMNPERKGIYGDAAQGDRDRKPDPSDRGQLLDPSDKNQFAKRDEPMDGDPNWQAPGAGSGPRVRPSVGAKNSENAMRRKLLAGPIRVKKIVTDKKKKKKS